MVAFVSCSAWPRCFLQPCRSSGCGCAGGRSAAGHSVLIQEFCADIRPGGFWFHISSCGIAGHTRVAPAAGGCASPCIVVCVSGVAGCWPWLWFKGGELWYHLLLPHHRSYLHQNYKITGCCSFVLCSAPFDTKVCVCDLRPRAGGMCLGQKVQAVLSGPQSPYGAPLLVGDATGGSLRRWGETVLVSGAGQGLPEGALRTTSAVLWLHQRCLSRVGAVVFWSKGLIAARSRLWDGAILNSDPLKSPSWWTEGVHLFVSHGKEPVVVLFCSLDPVLDLWYAFMEEGLRNKNNIFTSRALHQIYRCDPVIVLKGLFFRIDVLVLHQYLEKFCFPQCTKCF